MIYLK
jgi:hypothetical protein